MLNEQQLYQHKPRRRKKNETDIAVIGAGVIGLLTARRLSDQGYNITVYTDCPPEDTTSMKAGASFKPHEVEYTDPQLLLWSKEELARYIALYKDTGIRMHDHWEASSIKKAPPRYLSVMEKVTEYQPRKATDSCNPNVPGGYRYAWRYKTYLFDVPQFMSHLQTEVRRSGTTIQLQTVRNFSDVPQDIIFNCTGLGARALCHDTNMLSIKGQAAVIPHIQGMDWSISGDGFYIYNRQSSALLGGTAEPYIETTHVHPESIQKIIAGNLRVLGQHIPLDKVTAHAGLRPYRRQGIRTEAEEVHYKRIIHNYGHGGAGFTFAFGTVEQAIELAALSASIR